MSEVTSMNMINVSIERFLKQIEMSLDCHNYRAILGLGPGGIGKTEGVAGLTKRKGIGYKEIRLLNHTETDLIGVPIIEEIKQSDGTTRKVTNFASNHLLPVEGRDGKYGVLVIDEITSANKNMRTLAYQLLDTSRSIGNYKLPDGWLVVALGNGPEDGGNFQGMEGNLLTRCDCYRVNTDVESWAKWAVENEVNPTVVAFVKAMPEFIHNLNVNEDAHVFSCPRTLKALSDKLNYMEKAEGRQVLDPESVGIYAASSIGLTSAMRFQAFYRFKSQAVDITKIMSGEEKQSTITSTEVYFIVCENLISELHKVVEHNKTSASTINDKAMQIVANVCKWGVRMAEIKLEMAVVLFKGISQVIRLFSAIIASDEFDELCPEFSDFALENTHIFR